MPTTNGITNDLREFNTWRQWIYGAYTVHDVIQAVQEPHWQRVRGEMKGSSLEFKYERLRMYIWETKTPQGGIPHNVKVQVTNYIYALKRGGLIK